MKKLVLLGTNGSIGKQSLEVLEKYKEKIEIVALSFGENINGAEEIIKKTHVNNVSFKNEKDYFIYKTIFKNVHFYYGDDSIIHMLNDVDFDICLNALSGFSGFLPSVVTLKKSKTLLLANKETLVVGGTIIKDLLKENNGKLIPIDSEHVAIEKCLKFEDKNKVKNIVLTASGGPFYDRDETTFDNISVKDALNHPTWKMGKRISIDSSTMINKCFEIIEAYYLFNVPSSKIKVMVDRKSYVHSYVEYTNKTKLNVSICDMKNPITYALNESLGLNKGVFTDVIEGKPCDFSLLEMNYKKFPLINYAQFVIDKKGDSGAVLNAADEEAVKNFINGKIKYVDIKKIIDKIMNSYHFKNDVSIRDLVSIDKKVRKAVNYLIEKRKY